MHKHAWRPFWYPKDTFRLECDFSKEYGLVFRIDSRNARVGFEINEAEGCFINVIVDQDWEYDDTSDSSNEGHESELDSGSEESSEDSEDGDMADVLGEFNEKMNIENTVPGAEVSKILDDNFGHVDSLQLEHLLPTQVTTILDR